MNRHDRRARAKQDPRMDGMEVRYGGRTVHVTIWINTDEDEKTVSLRVHEAARGPRKDMAVVAGGVCDEEAARAVWAKVIDAAADTIAKEPQA